MPLGDADAGVGGLEAQQQLATGREQPGELGEQRRHPLRRGVDDRIPGDDAAEGAVGEREALHVAHLETQPGAVTAGQCDHLRGQVDAECLHPEVMQVGRDVARSAAEVGDGGGSAGRGRLGADEFGERAQQCPVQRAAGQFAAEHPRVAFGDAVVGLGGHGQIRLVTHSR